MKVYTHELMNLFLCSDKLTQALYVRAVRRYKFGMCNFLLYKHLRYLEKKVFQFSKKAGGSIYLSVIIFFLQIYCSTWKRKIEGFQLMLDQWYPSLCYSLSGKEKSIILLEKIAVSSKLCSAFMFRVRPIDQSQNSLEKKKEW